jgi:hypothetical protein
MISPHRQYRAAFVLAVTTQAILVATMYYINCGATSAVLTVPPCQPWLPDNLISFLHSLRLLGEPGFSLVPRFRLTDSLAVPDWLHEWAWMIAVSSVNVVVWTAGIGSGLMLLARLHGARARNCS